MALIKFQTKTELAAAAAEMTIGLLSQAIRSRGIAHIALSGGGTPRPVYELLAIEPLRSQLLWEHVHVYWADERCVPPDDPGSNYLLARQSLLDHVSIPAAQIHRVKGEDAPEIAAADYRLQLRGAATGDGGWPRIDVAIMGMGSDGHTASLFPGPISDQELTQGAIAVTADYDGRPANRVTLTPLVLNAARTLIFLVTGEAKAATLAAIFDPQRDPVTYPVQRIQPLDGDVVWLVDRAASPN